MVRMDGAEVRKERIAQINKIVRGALYANKDVGWISLSIVACKIEVETGLRHDKIIEILRLLSRAGNFELDEKDDKIEPASE